MSEALKEFTIDTFKPRVGELFRVVVDEKWEMQMHLSEVSVWGHEEAKSRPRHPFSLIFHAAPNAVIPQGIYPVENANMDPFELFLVPIGPDPRGMQYEAVFT